MKKQLTKLAIGLLITGLIAVTGCGSQPTSQSTASSQPAPASSQSASSANSQNSNSPSQNLPKIVTLATNPAGTITNTLGTGISTLLTKTMGTQVKIMTTNGPQEFYPLMKDNQADLGIENSWDAVSGWKGTSTYGPISDNKGFDVRLIISGSQLIDQLVVANTSNIKSGADLKGKKFAGIISSSPGMTLLCDAMLANFGLTRSDVIEINVPSIAAGVDAVNTGQADAAMVAKGTPQLLQLDSSSKGARVLSLDNSPAAVKRMTDIYPGEVIPVQPGGDNVGVKEANTNIFAFDFYMVGRTGLSDDTAYAMVKSLWENNKDLTAINKNLSEWTKDKFLTANFTIPYHPGVIKFFKEQGVWTDATQKHQDELLASKK